MLGSFLDSETKQGKNNISVLLGDTVNMIISNRCILECNKCYRKKIKLGQWGAAVLRSK